ncbi:hypothetical protein B0T16DRAFT_427288 [Cercophora newfieldiana]|uniref:Rhodopsin domain-containing protein n=1 Tax=Cercophora newfieldiana TaxID=92897 RepID=A0AA39YI39_9PEZI|nr:hypothetical protein B0T16DRAFT_427288 [Cercophora newfieldiana]
MFYISDRAVDLARVHMAVTVPLLVLTLLPLSARLHHRVRPISRFGWDDALILLGFACTITDWGLLAREMFFSPQLINYDTLTHAVKHQFLGIFFWCVAMICIKTSIALTLLRIPLEHPAWRPFLFVTIAVQTIWFIGDTIYMFVKCRPLSANWDLSISAGQCADVQTDVLVSSIGSALHVVTSLALSIAPMLVLAKLRRPLRERILVCVLTGMGIFSSVASVIKAVKVGQWRGADDEWAYAISIATWTIVEQLVAVIAACSPSLKGPIESILGRCGINLTQTSNFSFVAKSKGGWCPSDVQTTVGLTNRYLT